MKPPTPTTGGGRGGKAEERLHRPSRQQVGRAAGRRQDGVGLLPGFIPLYRLDRWGLPTRRTSSTSTTSCAASTSPLSGKTPIGWARCTKRHRATDEEARLRTARQTWQGEAAEAADAKVEGFTEAGTTVCAETEDFAGAISPAMDGIQQVVREYASFVLELGKEMKCAGKTPQETQDEIRKARGDLEFSDLADVGIDDLFSGAWAAFKEHGISLILGMTFKVPSWLEPGERRATRSATASKGKAWLDTSFKPEFDAKFSQFQQYKAPSSRVQEIYYKLLGTQISESPFDPPAEALSGEAPATTLSSTNQPSANDRGGGDIGGGGNDNRWRHQPDSGGMPEGHQPPPEAGAAGLPQAVSPSDTEEQSVTLGEAKAVTIHKPEQDGKVEVELLGEDGKPKVPAGLRRRVRRGHCGAAGRPPPVKLDSRCPAQLWTADSGPARRSRCCRRCAGADEDVIPGKPVRTARSSSRRATGLVFERTGRHQGHRGQRGRTAARQGTVSFGGGETARSGTWAGRSSARREPMVPLVGLGWAGAGAPKPDSCRGRRPLSASPDRSAVGAGPGVGVPGQVGAKARWNGRFPAGAGAAVSLAARVVSLAAQLTGGDARCRRGRWGAGGFGVPAVLRVHHVHSELGAFLRQRFRAAVRGESGEIAPGGADEQRAPGGTAGIGSMGQAQVGARPGPRLGSMQDAARAPAGAGRQGGRWAA